MELKITTDLSVIPKQIEFNYEQIKAELDGRLDKYKNLVVVESEISAAKKDRAKLNKLKTAIDDKRKELKAECLAPYNSAEPMFKEITGMIDAAILAIDNQTKAFETAEKNEKLESLKHFYKSNARDLQDLIPYEKIHNPKWLNKTYDLLKCTEEIIGIIKSINSDLEAIAELHVDHELSVKDVYLRTLNLAEALKENSRLNALKSDLDNTPVAHVPVKSVDVVPNEPIEEIHLTIYVKKTQKKALGEFMRGAGIKYKLYEGEKENAS